MNRVANVAPGSSGRPRVALPALALVCALAWSACGSKTGLAVPDAEVDAGMDAAVDSSIPCIEFPIDGGLIDLPLSTEVQVGRADVVFNIDTTDSMSQEIAVIRNNLRGVIAPGIARTIQDSQIGVTTFADFPEGQCGTERRNDLPFRLVLPVTSDVSRVQVAVDSIGLNNGVDEPEAQVEALYQIATGEGIGAYVAPSQGCPSGGIGYPCFREDAVPVVLIFTDAPFHNGPGGSEPYSAADACPGIVPAPHTYSQAVAQLNALGVHVIGLYSGPGGGAGWRDLRRLATDTGAIAGSDPLVFDIGPRGERLSESVVQAIETLAQVLTFDTIDTVLVDPDHTDGVDPRDFIERVVPIRAEPMSGVQEIDTAAGVFRGVQTGTTVTFELQVKPGISLPGPGPHRFLLEIVFRGDMRTRLGSTTVEIVIGGTCEPDAGVGVTMGVPS
jgi:predicted small lipoprotein YifL